MNDKKDKPNHPSHHKYNREEFKYISKRLQILEKWTELAIRPPSSHDCPQEDLDLFVNGNNESVENECEVVDNLPKLQQRCLHVRRLMNSTLLPPFPCAHPYEKYLLPKPSQIPNAGLGLFYCPPSPRRNNDDADCNGEGETTFFYSLRTSKEENRNDSHESCHSTDDYDAPKDEIIYYSNNNNNNNNKNNNKSNDRNNQGNSNIIPPGQVLCYYTGHRHTYQSSKSLKDISYLLMVGNSNHKKEQLQQQLLLQQQQQQQQQQLDNNHHDDDEISKKIINNDYSNTEIEEELEDETNTTVFVDPGPLLQIKARYINDPLNEDFVNCQFVPGLPHKYSCAVVSTKSISPHEELFISYGDLYSWSSSSSSPAGRQSMSSKYIRNVDENEYKRAS